MREYLKNLATDEWNSPLARVLKLFLWILSLVYGGLVWTVLFFYRSRLLKTHRLPTKVISVGNITWGGVGKTPFVEFLATHLKDHQMKLAILTRGYMSQASGVKKHFSDEATLLKNLLPQVPVYVGRDRVLLGQQALQDSPIDAMILDDGFQHWRLHRDLNIVLIDATHPFGNGALIPRGILREPLSSLRRAHIFVLTKTNGVSRADIQDIKDRLMSLNAKALIVESVHQPIGFVDLFSHQIKENPYLLKGKDVCSFCSIGDSSSFERTLTHLGINLKKNFPFLDHHVYHLQDIQMIMDYCRQEKIEALVTTEKDAVKLESFLPQLKGLGLVLSLRIEIQITKQREEFFERVMEAFRS